MESLARLVPKLLAHELDRFQLEISSPDAERGRGLVTRRAVREGEVICDASALYFDDEQALRAFLEQDGAGDFNDKVMNIGGALRDQVLVPVWAVLVGAAQYAQHYLHIKRGANAQWDYDPTLGFNKGSPKLVASTRTASPMRLFFGWESPSAKNAI